jgi:serine/threonine protein kinase
MSTETTPVASKAPLSPEELAPHFPQLKILECLGRGGMGVVYKATQLRLDRLVALKLLAPEKAADEAFATRFEKEAKALATLNHPHIVTIHDFGQAGGFYYLIMEFVDGVNLRQALQTGRFLPEQALAVIPPVCEALQFAHEHGIVHRDIKPENLLLDKRGVVKIADFGIAKILSDTADSSATLVTQNAVGTPAYAAPEQRSDPRRVDHRADIYSLGVVLYEMLTGELPGQSLEPPSRRVKIDVRLDEIVLRALETRPEMRFATIADLNGELKTMQEAPAPVTSPKWRVSRLVWPAAAALLLLAAALAWQKWSSPSIPTVQTEFARQVRSIDKPIDFLLPPANPPQISGDVSFPPSTPPPNIQAPPPASGAGIPDEALPALQVLRDFLAAPKLTERLKFTLAAEMLKPVMERYYASSPDGPIQGHKITFSRFDQTPELIGAPHCVFSVESKEWAHPVPVILKKSASGWKVDWLTFVELKDRKLEAFFESYTEKRALFHVGIHRQHYFENDVPDRDQKEAFSIGLPKPNPLRKVVFLRKDTRLARQLRDQLPWETHVWAIVELQWKKLGSQQWVELVFVPQLHWYGSAHPNEDRLTGEIDDVRKLLREAEKQHPGNSDLAFLMKELAELEIELAAILNSGLGRKHPEMISLEQELTALCRRIRTRIAEITDKSSN